MGPCGRQAVGVTPGALRMTGGRLLPREAVCVAVGALESSSLGKEVCAHQRPGANTFSSTALPE